MACVACVAFAACTFVVAAIAAGAEPPAARRLAAAGGPFAPGLPDDAEVPLQLLVVAAAGTAAFVGHASSVHVAAAEEPVLEPDAAALVAGPF